MLQAANASPVAQVFVESLPIAGVDGTMRNRLTNAGALGNAHIKTGTLRDVRAIAGYVGAANGESYVVVSFINDPRAEAARAAHDALLEWVYEGARKPGTDGMNGAGGHGCAAALASTDARRRPKISSTKSTPGKIRAACTLSGTPLARCGCASGRACGIA